MAITRRDAVGTATRFAADELDRPDVLGVVLWGSIIEFDDDDLFTSDIDMLVIVQDLRPYYEDRTVLFGLPVDRGTLEGCRFDVFYADTRYIEAALAEGRWTVVDALRHGIRIKDGDTLERLAVEAASVIPFELHGPLEWMNQAAELLAKSSRKYRNGDTSHSVVLARDAAQAAIYTLVYAANGKPPSPSSFLRELARARGTGDLKALFLDIHGLGEDDAAFAALVQNKCRALVDEVARVVRNGGS